MRGLVLSRCVHIHFVPLYIYQVALLLLRQRRGAVGCAQGTTIKFLRRTSSGAAGNGLGATMNYLRHTTSGAAGNGLGTTIKYPATHNERRRGERFEPVPGITDVPIHHKRPAFAFFCVRESVANK